MSSCMLTVAFSSKLTNKFVLYLPHGYFTDVISEVAIPRENVKWFRAKHTATYWGTNFCIISYDYLHLNTAAVTYVSTWLLGSFWTQQMFRADHSRLSDRLSLNIGNLAMSWIFMKFSIALFYEKLSSKHLFCENRLSDCHTFVIRQFIVLPFKHKTNCYISRSQPMKLEVQTLNLLAVVTADSDVIVLQVLITSNTKHKSEAHSCNHCWSGIAILHTKLYECLYSCFIYPACNAPAPHYIAHYDLYGRTIFFHIIS